MSHIIVHLMRSGKPRLGLTSGLSQARCYRRLRLGVAWMVVYSSKVGLALNCRRTGVFFKACSTADVGRALSATPAYMGE